jgi:glucose/arabinose dehydrogenase
MKKNKMVFIYLFSWLSAMTGMAQEYTGQNTKYKVEPVVEGLEVPWGMTWLPDGSMLVTERSGKLLQIKDGNQTTVTGLPEIYASGQGGLMEIALHPEYASNGWIYFTYSFRQDGGGNTALMRARLREGELIDNELLFEATPNATTRHHYGGRIAFDKEGYLFLTLGERGNGENAQDRSVTSGSILRLNDDGSVPKDNPFAGQEGIDAAIWSYGHRNPQGIAFHPETGTLYNTEHGPQGGDELNIVTKGTNYGWPVITYGKNYDGTLITAETAADGMQQPLYYWVPSIAPSSLMFVTSDKFSAWKGDALVGSLKFNYLVRVNMDGDKVLGTEILLADIGRVRDVRQGPHGNIYVAVEGKGIYKLSLIE